MSLDDWGQYPFTGALSAVENEGIKLVNSGPRLGHHIYSKQWFNLQGSTVYLKWKAGNSSYSGFGPTIGHLGLGGFFTTNYSYNGSTVITPGIWYYTMISCNADHVCTSETSTGNYPDQNGVSVRSDVKTLTPFQQEVLSATPLRFGFGDGSDLSQFGILGQAIVKDGSEILKPTQHNALYSGEGSIPPPLFIENNNDDTNCIWEIEAAAEGNVIKGTRLAAHLGNCFLGTSIENVRGVSFSMKTQTANNFAGVGLRYESPLALVGSPSSSDWKDYFLPTVKSPEVLKWHLHPQENFYNYDEFLWLKDIKLWYGSDGEPGWLVDFVGLEADFGTTSVNEISVAYDISKTRNVEHFLYETNCKTLVSIGSGNVITGVTPSTTDKDSTLETLTLDYNMDKTALAASRIWNSLTEEIEICQVVQLTEPAAENKVISKDTRRFNIAIDFDITYDDMPVELADETIGEEYGDTSVQSYLEAFKCNEDFTSNTAPHLPNTKLHLCFRSKLAEIEYDHIMTTTVTQELSDGSLATMIVMADGIIENPTFSELVFEPSKNGACLNIYVPTDTFEYGSDKQPIIADGSVSLKLTNVPENGRKLRTATQDSDDIKASYKISIDLQDEPIFEEYIGEASSAIIGKNFAMVVLISLQMISFSFLWN